jgi:short-subunit dehydrogenase
LEIDQKIMAINFFGTIALTKPTLKRMLDRSCGQIVCVSSLVGLLGVKNRTIYSASKHALRGYFESLRHELHQSPIKITMVYPGYIDTNMPQNALLKSGLPNALQEKTHLDGMKAEDCASQIVKAIEKELPEIIVARPLERAAVFVSQHLPGLFRWLFPRLYR